jgi:hypothetical protein
MKQEQAQRLFKAIQEIKPVVKDKLNPHFKNSYADINTMLEDVKPIMHANGLFIMQPIIDGSVISQIIDGESGDIVAASSLPINANLAAQAKGSEITYYRRYTLQSLLGLEAEDDDANKSSTQKPAFTAANFESAYTKGSTIEQIKLVATVTPEIEKAYNEFVKSKTK